jgi:hypothetical protein
VFDCLLAVVFVLSVLCPAALGIILIYASLYSRYNPQLINALINSFIVCLKLLLASLFLFLSLIYPIVSLLDIPLHYLLSLTISYLTPPEDRLRTCASKRLGGTWFLTETTP